MKNLLLLLAYLLTAVARHLGPGGANAVIAENLLVVDDNSSSLDEKKRLTY
jgi:hypothetical protein